MTLPLSLQMVGVWQVEYVRDEWRARLGSLFLSSQCAARLILVIGSYRRPYMAYMERMRLVHWRILALCTNIVLWGSQAVPVVYIAFLFLWITSLISTTHTNLESEWVD